MNKEVLNIAATSDSETGRRLGNLEEAHFELDGERFASIEGFWQGIKYPEGSNERRRIFTLFGMEAKFAGDPVKHLEELTYGGQVIKIGSPEHHELMKRALCAKLEQNPKLKDMLIASEEATIIHEPTKPDGALYPDSKTIPAAVYSSIMMELRSELRKAL